MMNDRNKKTYTPPDCKRGGPVHAFHSTPKQRDTAHSSDATMIGPQGGRYTVKKERKNYTKR